MSSEPQARPACLGLALCLLVISRGLTQDRTHNNHQSDHLSLSFTSFFPPDTFHPRPVADNTSLSRAAEGRLTFLDTYRNAYSGPESIKNHIKEGQNTINSGRRAVKEARLNYESMGILSTILAATNLDDNFRTLGKV